MIGYRARRRTTWSDLRSPWEQKYELDRQLKDCWDDVVGGDPGELRCQLGMQRTLMVVTGWAQLGNFVDEKLVEVLQPNVQGTGSQICNHALKVVHRTPQFRWIGSLRLDLVGPEIAVLLAVDSTLWLRTSYCIMAIMIIVYKVVVLLMACCTCTVLFFCFLFVPLLYLWTIYFFYLGGQSVSCKASLAALRLYGYFCDFLFCYYRKINMMMMMMTTRPWQLRLW